MFLQSSHMRLVTHHCHNSQTSSSEPMALKVLCVNARRIQPTPRQLRRQILYKYPYLLTHHSSSSPPIYHHTRTLVYYVYLSVTILSHSSMKTRAKNQSAHPAVPIMTSAQLSAAGISKSRPKRPKKQTKNQQIAALQEDLRAAQEMLQVATTPLRSSFRLLMLPPQNRPTSAGSISGTMSESPDHDGNTELATEDGEDDYTPTTSRKRAAQKPASTGIKYVVFFEPNIPTAF